MAEVPPYYRRSFFSSSTSLASESSSTVTGTSMYTTTSASFTAGPGELAGRGLNAFGKAALSGVRSVVVRRRLQALSSYFPHTTDDPRIQGLNSKEIYDQVLELSRYALYYARNRLPFNCRPRFGLYSSSIRTRALKMILRQIADGHTAQLTQSVLDWPPDEAVLFFSELLMCMDPSWTGFVT
jgi:hypothetical protein